MKKFMLVIIVSSILMGGIGCEKYLNTTHSTTTPSVTPENTEIPPRKNEDTSIEEKVAKNLYTEFIKEFSLIQELNTSSAGLENSNYFKIIAHYCKVIDYITGLDKYKEFLSDNYRTEYLNKRSEVNNLMKDDSLLSEDVLPFFSYYSLKTGDHIMVLSYKKYQYSSNYMWSYQLAYDYIRKTNDEHKLFTNLDESEYNGGAFMNVFDVFYENLYDDTSKKDVVPIITVDGDAKEPENEYIGPYISDKEIFDKYNRDYYKNIKTMNSGTWRLYGFDGTSENANVQIIIDNEVVALKNNIK